MLLSMQLDTLSNISVISEIKYNMRHSKNDIDCNLIMIRKVYG